MWVLSSSISKVDALDMLIRVQFDDSWSTIVNEEVLLMPTQRSMVHRVLPTASGVVYVTELATSRLASFSLEPSTITPGKSQCTSLVINIDGTSSSLNSNPTSDLDSSICSWSVQTDSNNLAC